MKTKKLVLFALAIVGGVLLLSQVVRAQAIRTGKSNIVAKDQTIDASLVTAGNVVDIAGTINGDVYCAGKQVHIYGTVHGDVICAGATIRVDGQVDGNVRIAGQNVVVGATVKGNVTIGGQDISLDKMTKVSGDAIVLGSLANIEGFVGRDLTVTGQQATINASIGRNVGGKLDQLHMGSQAKIQGNVDYTSKTDFTKDGATTIAGSVRRREPVKQNRDVNIFLLGSLSYVYIIISFLLLALVLVVLFPGLFEASTERFGVGYGQIALKGFAVLFGGPFVLLLLAFTLVGVPLMILTLLVWLVFLILAGPLVAYQLGRLLLKNISTKQPLLYVLIGGLVLLFLYALPAIGPMVMLTVEILGTGVLASMVFGHKKSPAKSKKK